MDEEQPKRAFSVQSFDNEHFKATEAYVAIIQRLFDRCTETIAAASVNIDPSKPFSFEDFPKVRNVMLKATIQLAEKMTTTILTGTRQQWEFANKKNDAMIRSIMDTSKLTKEDLESMQMRSTEALAAFQGRKVGKDGLNISQRVWRYVSQYREQIEDALDVGLGEGRDYRELARDIKANLQEPNRLFRRVRDKHGNLQLSKAAAAYHPGTGIYRSSVKNAQRLTRSEINMAYREADFQRWQTLDFVIGIDVVRSNWRDDKGNPYKCKLCERLKGRYPKTFKFIGWHPQCRCHAIPVMTDYSSKEASDDRRARLKAALYGTEYKKYVPKETITDLPEGFKEWMDENMEASQKWESTPYFIRDNFKHGNMKNGLLREPRAVDTDSVEGSKKKLSELTDEDERRRIKLRCMSVGLPQELYRACLRYGVSIDHYESMADKCADDPENNWVLLDDCDAEQRRLEAECDRRAAMDKATAQSQIDELNSAILDLKKWDKGQADVFLRISKDYLDTLKDQQKNRWGIYTRIIDGSCQRQCDAVRKAVSDMMAKWDDIKKDVQMLVDAAPDKSKVSKLSALANEKPSLGRDAKTIIKEIKKEIITLSETPIETEIDMAKQASEIKKMLLDRGICDDVNFNDMRIEDVRAISKAVAKVSSEFDLKPIGLRITKFPRSHSNALAHANGRYVEVNVKYWNSAKSEKIDESERPPEVYKKDIADNIARFKVWISDLEDKKKKDPKNANWYNRQIKKYTSELKKSQSLMDNGCYRWTIRRSHETYHYDTIIHELGHVLHDQGCGGSSPRLVRSDLDATRINTLRSEWSSLFRKHKTTLSGWCSEYALTNEYEFCAESFVLYWNNDPVLPSDVKKWFDDLKAFMKK